MSKDEDKFIYSEFEKIMDDKNKLINYDPYIREPRRYYGEYISDLKIGEKFRIWTNVTINWTTYQDTITSDVVEIFTPNLFRTMNSLYFIKDEAFQIQMQRENKLNQIL